MYTFITVKKISFLKEDNITKKNVDTKLQFLYTKVNVCYKPALIFKPKKILTQKFKNNYFKMYITL